jgi:hypothetical protein
VSTDADSARAQSILDGQSNEAFAGQGALMDRAPIDYRAFGIYESKRIAETREKIDLEASGRSFLTSSTLKSGVVN